MRFKFGSSTTHKVKGQSFCCQKCGHVNKVRLTRSDSGTSPTDAAALESLGPGLWVFVPDEEADRAAQISQQHSRSKSMNDAGYRGAVHLHANAATLHSTVEDRVAPEQPSKQPAMSAVRESSEDLGWLPTVTDLAALLASSVAGSVAAGATSTAVTTFSAEAHQAPAELPAPAAPEADQLQAVWLAAPDEPGHRTASQAAAELPTASGAGTTLGNAYLSASCDLQGKPNLPQHPLPAELLLPPDTFHSLAISGADAALPAASRQATGSLLEVPAAAQPAEPSPSCLHAAAAGRRSPVLATQRTAPASAVAASAAAPLPTEPAGSTPPTGKPALGIACVRPSTRLTAAAGPSLPARIPSRGSLDKLSRVASISPRRRRTAKAREQGVFNCLICFEDCPRDDVFVSSSCGHELCRACARQVVLTAMGEFDYPIACPLCKAGARSGPAACPKCALLQASASSLSDPRFCSLDPDVQLLLSPDEYDDYTEKSMKFASNRDQELVRCPKPDCPGLAAVLAKEPIFICPICSYCWCRRCKSDWHSFMTCEQWQRQQRTASEDEAQFRAYLQSHRTITCPTCGQGLQKLDGCNHLQCTSCKSHVCWLCGKRIQATSYWEAYLHYWDPDSTCYNRTYDRQHDLIQE